MNIELKDFELAAERLKPILHHTELDHSATFSAMTGGDIYLKCENRQKTGSFKIRGASNKIAALMERGGLQAVVASSAGNHAQGVACAARKFGIPATIVMPKAAPIAKVQATENYGARVVLAGDCYDDAYKRACEICEEEGATFLHPYNDIEVIAGQGTLGLEILGDLPSVDIVIAPAGGGGLLAGVAAAIKQINPRVKVYGGRHRPELQGQAPDIDRHGLHHCRRYRRQVAGRHHGRPHQPICRRCGHGVGYGDILRDTAAHGALQADS